jgi:multidrug efflux pump subunit AcrA (membrane-fusion protein)
MRKNIYSHIRTYITNHRVLSSIIAIVIVITVYYIYKSATATMTTPQYVLMRAKLGNITQTVTGTGQISADNQLDIQSQVSGTIKTINVSVGQHVHTGDLIATIDSTQALADLQSARIAMAKLTEAPKTADLESARNSLVKSYNDGFNSVSNTFLDLPVIMTGMKDIFYGQSGFLSDQNLINVISIGKTYRDTAGVSFDQANSEYATILEEYKGLSRSSATSSIIRLITDTYNLTKDVSRALQNTQNTLTYITTMQPDFQKTSATAAASNVNSWSSQINSDLASILAAQNTIQSNENSLTTLINGADTLDIQSQTLSLQQKERAYANYFIRAPFDGIIGRIPVSVYGQASGSTVIATLIGDNKVSTISLNEIDAAKVKIGQPVTITFDAIDDLNATGTVSVVDLVGTVTQGVVTYNAKISINTHDDRIHSGMSISTTIVTNQKKGVLVVPSSAVKTQGSTNYVQIFDSLPASATSSSALTYEIRTTTGNRSATNTKQFSNRNSSSTISMSNIASGTRQFTGNFTGSSSQQIQNQTVTISSATAPRQQTVTIGQSDDTNTEIVSGLSGGEWVVTRTITAAASQTNTPSLLSSFGGARTGATGGTVRTTTTGQ